MPEPLMTRRRGVILLGAMAGTAWASEAMKPTQRLSLTKAPILLEQQVPRVLDGWAVDASIIPLLPDASLQARLDVLYSQLLARTYVNRAGQRVMLSIAYGADQSSEATAVHRPEFCYSAQGFRVRGAGRHILSFGAQQVQVQRLIGEMGGRFEPITYWVTLDEHATLPGLSRKLDQLRFGLKGQIPDGMLLRVSTVGLPQEQSFAVQQEFLETLYRAISPSVRSRYFGS
ncbi:exosortase-associated protein EpsI, B-type [Pelomonas sp. Root1217]|uniref:exosortase-associated protein EpsI, B-type n=1 Tax=Pelomonas sp. Root1217 TaxID=1736430 RepID=UPI0009EB77F0|nr:exosortase-associated protein EpsI, B-type [Pelomonas sp. Root1217]